MSLFGSHTPCSGLTCVASALVPVHGIQALTALFGLVPRASGPRPQLRGSPTGDDGHACFLLMPCPSLLSLPLSLAQSSCSFSVLSLLPHLLSFFSTWGTSSPRQLQFQRNPDIKSSLPVVRLLLLFLVPGKFLHPCLPGFPQPNL